MPFEIVDGIQTHFLYFGTNKKSPVVIFIHGAGQSILCWKFQYSISESIEQYNFIFLDLPGHGKSEGEGLTTIREYSEFLHSFINKLNIEEYVLIGHSMGGRISQVNLVNYPEKAIGAVLAGTGPRIRVTRHTMDTAKKSLIDFADLASENSFANSASLELKTEFKSLLLKSNPETIINDLRACNKFDTTEVISDIKVPTYIIAGKEDKLAPINNSLHLKNSIPNSRIEIIDGAGHFMMQEKPEEFNNMVTGFLDYL